MPIDLLEDMVFTCFVGDEDVQDALDQFISGLETLFKSGGYPRRLAGNPPCVGDCPLEVELHGRGAVGRRWGGWTALVARTG